MHRRPRRLSDSNEAAAVAVAHCRTHRQECAKQLSKLVAQLTEIFGEKMMIPPVFPLPSVEDEEKLKRWKVDPVYAHQCIAFARKWGDARLEAQLKLLISANKVYDASMPCLTMVRTSGASWDARQLTAAKAELIKMLRNEAAEFERLCGQLDLPKLFDKKGVGEFHSDVFATVWNGIALGIIVVKWLGMPAYF